MSTILKSETPRAIPLSDRAVIAIEGKDAAHFLHNLVTAKVEGMPSGTGTLAALLTPQGKIISDMLIFNASEEGAAEGTYLIELGHGFVESVMERLGFYKLRADIGITRLPDEIGVTVVLDAEALGGESFYSFPDPRHAGLGQRLIGPKADIAAALNGIAAGESAEYHARRLALGVPEMGRDYPPTDAFPHEALLDQLGGVDFKKGCYVGQEVVSRMEHRGTARTRALPVRFLNGFGVLGGAEIKAGETMLGKVGEPSGDRAIGMIRLDRLEEALKSGIEVTGGGVPLAVERPDFVRFAVPGTVA